MLTCAQKAKQGLLSLDLGNVEHHCCGCTSIAQAYRSNQQDSAASATNEEAWSFHMSLGLIPVEAYLGASAALYDG